MKNGCWEWTGQLHPTGYGRFIFQGNRGFLSHRVSWIIHNGELSSDLLVCHKCDNRKCVNPDHLFIGTNSDNIQDRTLKNRSNRPFGNKFAPRKLKENDIPKIRKLLSEGFSQKEIGEKFGVSRSTIYKIKIGERWKNI